MWRITVQAWTLWISYLRSPKQPAIGKRRRPMPDPVVLPILGLPGYFQLWALTLVSFFVFGNRVVRHVRVLAQARPESRWDHVGQRVGLVVKNVLGQRPLLDSKLWRALAEHPGNQWAGSWLQSLLRPE